MQSQPTGKYCSNLEVAAKAKGSSRRIIRKHQHIDRLPFRDFVTSTVWLLSLLWIAPIQTSFAMMHPSAILTRAKVEQAMDTILSNADLAPLSQLANEYGLTLRRSTDDSSWKRICYFQAGITAASPDADEGTMLQHFQTAKTPWFFGMELCRQEDENICGFVTFYVAYSSWNGKILHLDAIQCSADASSNLQMKKDILQILANMAVEMGCARLTWTVSAAIVCVILFVGNDTPSHGTESS